jgi:SPP1 gp7 family putative phage head morphogenesis protein
MIEYVHQYIKNNQEAMLRGDSAALMRQDAIPGGSWDRMVASLYGWYNTYFPPLDDDGKRTGPPVILMGLGNIADTLNGFNEKQWEKAAKAELGVEFPVYEDWWPDARESWLRTNYELMRGLGADYIKQINILTEKAVTSGWSPAQLAQAIQKVDGKMKAGRANLIARDQIGKLNGMVTQARMESIGLDMYIWSTSGDERVRPSHEMMDGGLCLWSDSSVYSQDGGKTWIDRPAGAVLLHPGQDYQCRCTALSYWDELVGEADEMIAQYEELDALSAQNTAPAPKAAPPEPPLKKFAARKKTAAGAKMPEEKERRRREENARKSKDAADRLFPGEKWKKIEDGVYISPHRPTGEKTSCEDEKHDSLILKLLGSIIYLVPEQRNAPGKKYDAIVDGERFEFKNMKGASTVTLKDHFLRSRKQAPNVFINLENSPLAKSEIIRTLYRARNSDDYKKHNMFKGGKIILKIRGQTGLIYLNVDDLKISGK